MSGVFLYPKGVKPPKKEESIKEALPRKKDPRAANRGMDFESEINETNAYYLQKDLCVVYKRPTPIKIVKVDYTRGAKIKEAYFETQSTTDYNGVYKGRYLDFEAKECRSKTSFPLHNVPAQQIEHLKRVIAHGGIAFFLIRFTSVDETYFLPASYLISFLQSGGRKSIPIDEVRKNGARVKEGFRPRYDYLSLVDDFFLK